MKKYFALLTLLLAPCIARADGIAPMAAFYLDIPILILLIPIALIEAIYIYKKLNCKSFFRILWASFWANVITTLIGCIFVPISALVQLIISISVDGALEGGYGWEKLGLPLAILIQWGLILLPALFLFWISYKLEYKYINRTLRKKATNTDTAKIKKAVFNANVITYFLITFSLLFLEANSLIKWANARWQPTPACTIEHPLRGLRGFVQPPPSIIEKRGECFDCNNTDDIILTTKAECDKCSHRHYTGKACVLNECPPEKPVRMVNSSKPDGYYCGSCVKYMGWPINEDEPCQKCPNHPHYYWDKNGKCIWHEKSKIN